MVSLEPNGWSLRRLARRGGKSELRRAACWVTPRPGDGTESATESRPPAALLGRATAFQGLTARSARVKRCGKSAPAPAATPAARQTPRGARPNRGAFEAGPAEAPG